MPCHTIVWHAFASMQFAHLYLPQDRRSALLQRTTLPEYTEGSVLFADISGFTPLTEAFMRILGAERGAEVLTVHLNQIFDALISEVDRYGGSVIGFAGDAITCLFLDPTGIQSTRCAFAMQRMMARFAQLPVPDGSVVALAMKAAVVIGPARRFLVGDPDIHVIEVLAGSTLDRMAAAEKQANPGEVLLDEATAASLHPLITISAWRDDPETMNRFAVVNAIQPDTARVPSTAPLAPSTHTTALGVELVRPWLLPPVYERLTSGQHQFLAEIRSTVVLFLRFGGIDYDNDPEAGHKLRTYIQWAQQVITSYEGFLLQVTIGDKGSYFYATFGALYAHDDDPARAVAAALDLQTPPPDCPFIQSVQIGITHGRAYAGAYGGRTRHTYGVLGDEVNLSARLMMKADPGQILVSQHIASAVADAYLLQSLGTIQVKGKGKPVQISLVLGPQRRLATPTTGLALSPLVGRHHELALLDQALAQVLTGQGRVVQVEGGAGIGKTHLVSAWATQAHQQHNIRLLAGMCQSVSQHVPYTPWRPIVLDLLGLSHMFLPTLPYDEQVAALTAAIQQHNPDWLLRLPLLGDLLGIPIPDNPTTAAFESRLRQDALFALIIELVQRCAGKQPVLIRLEDVHWIDESSAALTQALCRVIAPQPILVCLTQRPPLPDQKPGLPELSTLDYYQHLTLTELDATGVQTLVADRLLGQPCALLLSLIENRAQGNPFFIEELLDTLHESHMLTRQPDATWGLDPATVHRLQSARCLERDAASEWVISPNAPLTAILDIPDSLHSIVLSRMDRLSEIQKLTLKVASVIGQIFELDVLLQAHPLALSRETLLEVMHTLEGRDFTRLEVPPPRIAYIFRHNITQEVAYATMLEAQRQQLHQAVGETLEQVRPDAVETLAYHFQRTDQRDKMLLYLDKAARKSRYEHANETALHYYSQALQHEERWEWRYGQAAIYHMLGEREAEAAALEQLKNAPDVPTFAAWYLWGQYYEAIGDYDLARDAFQHALADYQQRGHPAGQARCLTQLGVVARRRGDYASASQWLEQATYVLDTQTARSIEGAQVYVRVLNELGLIYETQGRYEETRTAYNQALEVSRTHGNRESEAHTLSNIGGVAYVQGNFAEAFNYHQQSLELRRAIGDRAGEGSSLGNMSIALQTAGDYGQQAQEYGFAALAIQQAVGNRWDEVNTWNSLGVMYQELGDLPRAQACLQRGLHISQAIGDQAGQAYILANLGLIARDLNDLETARWMFTEGLTLVQAQDDKDLIAWFLSYLASVMLLLGKPEHAITQAQEALTLHRELYLVVNTTATLGTLAAAYLALGNTSQARDYTQQALAILDQCGGEGPECPQRDYLACSRVLAALGEQEAAREALCAAYSIITTRAEKITDPDLRQSFLTQVAVNRQIIEAMEKQEELEQREQMERSQPALTAGGE